MKVEMDVCWPQRHKLLTSFSTQVAALSHCPMSRLKAQLIHEDGHGGGETIAMTMMQFLLDDAHWLAKTDWSDAADVRVWED